MKVNFRFIRQLFELLLLIVIVFISSRRAWNCLFVPDFSLYYCEYGDASTDMIWWTVAVLGIFLLMMQSGLMERYIAGWKSNKLLLVFLAYAALSLIWTVDLYRSLHTLVILIAASLIAAGLATLYRSEKIFELLLWFAGLTSLLSLIAVITIPQAAITQGIFLPGTWRGIFAHKNYFGSVMALANGLFLITLLHGFSRTRVTAVNAGFYLLTLILVVMSQSATGLITLIFLNGITLVYRLWLKFRMRLQRHHYLMLAAGLAVFAGVMLLNLNFLFSLAGRNSTLTGRLPLWQYLIREVVGNRPWFGYGLETVWYERAFQLAAGKGAGWGIVVVNSHNGYMDILVYLGIIGLAIFLLLAARNFIRAWRYALSASQPQMFAALLVLVYVLVANITISYIVEFESFHWLLFVLVLFITTQSPNTIEAQNVA